MIAWKYIATFKSSLYGEDMQRFFKYGILLLLTVSCTPKPLLQKVQAINTNLSQYNTVHVHVKGKNNSIEKVHGFNPTRDALKRQFIEDLKDEDMFTKVLGNKPENYGKDSLSIDLVIEELNYRHATMSFFFGIFSGNSHIKILAELSDTTTGESVGTYRFGAKNKTSGGIFRGGTSKLIVQISEKLVDEIARYKR